MAYKSNSNKLKKRSTNKIFSKLLWFQLGCMPMGLWQYYGTKIKLMAEIHINNIGLGWLLLIFISLLQIRLCGLSTSQKGQSV